MIDKTRTLSWKLRTHLLPEKAIELRAFCDFLSRTDAKILKHAIINLYYFKYKEFKNDNI